MCLSDASNGTMKRLQRHRDVIMRLARLQSAEICAGAPPQGALEEVVDEATVILPLADVIDIGKEQGRLKRECDKAAGDLARIDKKLENPQFLAKAPEHVVEELRERRESHAALLAKISKSLDRLSENAAPKRE